MTLEWAIALLVPATLAWAVISLARGSHWAQRLADHPNERSLHSVATPRVGGIGLLAGALPVATAFSSQPIGALLACAAALAVVSLADDLRSLPIEVRLPAHFAAATVAVLASAGPSGTSAGLGVAAAIVAVVGLVWMTNLFNFMDGSDGLAGAMAAIGFGAFALAAHLGGEPALALAAAAIASASLGFLAHNFPPARVFLGDAGSIPLGFLAGALGLLGVLQGTWPAWFPVLVFSPFIVDATVTIARRIVRRERFWRPHRSHYYQRLVLGGWTPRRLAGWACVLMLAAAGSALLALAGGPEARFGIILGWALFYLLLIIVVERRARSAVIAQ